jgi:hypothetical protein
MSNRIVRATAEIKLVPNKKRPGANHGFQACKLVDQDGGYEKFELYFDPAKGSFALAPGDYSVEASQAKVIDGRLVIYPDFVPVGQKKAA